ncbi:permease prefix domain 1-containing protein [bacterium]|nr:permease prefix domain 1-containing protein [bacterium]
MLVPPDWKDAISRAMRGDFGPPGESLRSDIMDELADHLSESMNREERAGRSEAEARERVLKRFGSPSQIAARLWFDGMKGSVMFQRWMMGVSAVALLLAFVAIGLAFWMVQENNRVLLAAVEKLQDHRGATTQSMDWVTLRFKCIDEKTGQPIQNVFLSLGGSLISASRDQLTTKTDKDGLAKLGPLRPGTHEFVITPSGKWHYNGSLLVMPGENEEFVIRCPEVNPPKTQVRIRLPEIVRGATKAINIIMKPVAVIDNRRFVNTTKIRFDRIITANGESFGKANRPANDLEHRIEPITPELELLAGTYHLDIRFFERQEGWSSGQPTPSDARGSSQVGGDWDRSFVSASGKDNLELDMVAMPDTVNEWVVPTQDELPSEWLEEAKAKSASAPVDASSSETFPSTIDRK